MSLQNFPSFSVYAYENTAGICFEKRLSKFEDLCAAYEIIDNKQKKLFYYIICLEDEGFSI